MERCWRHCCRLRSTRVASSLLASRLLFRSSSTLDACSRCTDDREACVPRTGCAPHRLRLPSCPHFPRGARRGRLVTLPSLVHHAYLFPLSPIFFSLGGLQHLT